MDAAAQCLVRRQMQLPLLANAAIGHAGRAPDGTPPHRVSVAHCGTAADVQWAPRTIEAPEQRRDFEAFVKSRCKSKQPLLAFDADEAAKWPNLDSIFRDLDERTCLQFTNP
jgi:hypothetical protein